MYGLAGNREQLAGVVSDDVSMRQVDVNCPAQLVSQKVFAFMPEELGLTSLHRNLL